jgi:hypothetical protein
LVLGPVTEAQIESLNDSIMTNPTPDPYGDLFIYYLEGCLRSGSSITDRSFIGNWEEEGYSFLFFKRSSPQIIESLTSQQPHLKLLDNFHMSYEEWHGGPVLPVRIGQVHVIPPWIKTLLVWITCLKNRPEMTMGISRFF